MPVEDPTKRPRLGVWARNVCPNLIGGKNWEPMSYSPQTGLVYIPLFNMCMDIANKNEEYTPGKFYLASEFNLDMAGLGRQEPGRVRRLGSGRQEEGLGHQGRPAVPERGHDHCRRPGVLRQPARRCSRRSTPRAARSCGSSTSAPASCKARSPTSIGGKQYVAVVAGRTKGPPSFFGKIGQSVIDASPEGGILVVFELCPERLARQH